MPKKGSSKENKENLEEEDKKQKRTQNWNQNDTEFLAQLVLDHGRKGILSKETNVSTNKQREIEWDAICKNFNDSAMVRNSDFSHFLNLFSYRFDFSYLFSKVVCARNVSSLQTRYKKILKAVKVHSAWQTANNRATGGGPQAIEPQPDGIKVVGVLQALKDHYGAAVTGLVPQDNDSDPLRPPINFENVALTEKSILDCASEVTEKAIVDEEEYSDTESTPTTSSVAPEIVATTTITTATTGDI